VLTRRLRELTDRVGGVDSKMSSIGTKVGDMDSRMDTQMDRIEEQAQVHYTS
jgi:hypothetical protein